ncbi:hypothetical protein Q1695_010424 [Nippostrongylus brasiliensis]|nr:hypothetical protein Q1695_010424 [Nippostrongylus brasiliensis]
MWSTSFTLTMNMMMIVVLVLLLCCYGYAIVSFRLQTEDCEWDDLSLRRWTLSRIYYHEMEMSRFWVNPDVE